MIPHHEKVASGGEDSYGFSSDSCLICVADGVGGWRKKGIDPGLFSKDLVANYLNIYENQRHLGNMIKVTDRATHPSPIQHLYFLHQRPQ